MSTSDDRDWPLCIEGIAIDLPAKACPSAMRVCGFGFHVFGHWFGQARLSGSSYAKKDQPAETPQDGGALNPDLLKKERADPHHNG
ncbi:hypothetical protein [Ruegeria jejuensis]|uniref:hypothetical protein n=1 Tax=Ruegeria jejuensis TaxID=3233338 RepID=UPI00355C7B9F